MPPVPSGLLSEVVGPGGRLFVVSNRGPVTFEAGVDAPDGLTAARGSGGLVTALADLGRLAPLTWIAAARTEADARVAPALVAAADARRSALHDGHRNGPALGRGHGRTAAGNRVPPSRGRRTEARVGELLDELLPGQDLELRFVTLPPEVRHGHYEVVANPFLWFLQHQMYALPYGPNVDAPFVDAWRTGYRRANVLLADAAVEAAARVDRPTFLVQDYHLYLAPERIRERRPDATILHFTHIPWPPAAIWQVLPQGMRRAICEALLACDVVGLQTDRHATNFLETVENFIGDAHVDPDGRLIRWRERRIRVGTYPICLDPDRLRTYAHSPVVEERLARLRARLERAGWPRVIVRADRIEPSKNALRGFLAFEDLLGRRPELRAAVRFVAVQAPTRTALPEYARYATEVRETVARINGMDEPDDQPIWIHDGSDYAMAIAALRIADVVLVNPVLDGMNLVAKEAVVVGERDPVLVLSETAGAAEQLAIGSLTVAPADVVGTAWALDHALEMDPEERRARLRRMRRSVREEDIGWWLTRQLRDLAAIRRGDRAPSRRLRDAIALDAAIE